jgi:hypothetical protein
VTTQRPGGGERPVSSDVATERSIEVTLRFDITGGRTSVTRGKLEAAVSDLVERGLAA